jgi:hypothetical protein
MGPRSPGWRSTGNPRPWEGEGADADALTSHAWRWGGTVFDPLDLLHIILGSSVAGTVVYQLSKGLRTAWVERSRRKTTLAVMDRLIQRERELGQPGPSLEVVRPPPDQLLGTWWPMGAP